MSRSARSASDRADPGVARLAAAESVIPRTSRPRRTRRRRTEHLPPNATYPNLCAETELDAAGPNTDRTPSYAEPLARLGPSGPPARTPTADVRHAPSRSPGWADRRTAAPPHPRTPAPPHRRTAAPPHRRTAAPPHRRTAAPPHDRTLSCAEPCPFGAERHRRPEHPPRTSSRPEPFARSETSAVGPGAGGHDRPPLRLHLDEGQHTVAGPDHDGTVTRTRPRRRRIVVEIRHDDVVVDQALARTAPAPG